VTSLDVEKNTQKKDKEEEQTMSLTLNEKIRRIISLIIAARDPGIFPILASRGFTQEVLEEGWSLVSLAAGAKLHNPLAVSAMPEIARTLLAKLDTWEDSWYPLISATLERHHPALQAQVFENLGRTSGPELVLSISVLLDRLNGMSQSAEGQQALALLVARGVTEEVLQEARGIINKLKTFEGTVQPELEAQIRLGQEKVIDAAWAWYREWSQIARTVVQRKDQLKRLGLRNSRKGNAESGEVTEPPAENPVS
jgi:hypothetical protein